MPHPRTMLFALSLVLLPVTAYADMDDFHAGEAIKNFGKIADVPGAMSLEEGLVLKHSFDLRPGAEPGEINRGLDTAARFINMHYAAGVPLENIQVAVVVHGGAVFDVTNAGFYAAQKEGAENANIALVRALLGAGARIIVCGQSAAAQDVSKGDLLPGVELALSAMTAHALLQQQGYTMNPF